MTLNKQRILRSRKRRHGNKNGQEKKAHRRRLRGSRKRGLTEIESFFRDVRFRVPLELTIGLICHFF